MILAALPLVSSVLGGLASSATGSAAATQAARAATATGGTDFGQVMSKVATDAMNSVKGAESAAVDGITGKGDIQTVVQSVMSAQESLQTALAIRDKSVSAFQEITKMSI